LGSQALTLNSACFTHNESALLCIKSSYRKSGP
jgi:hypothetical protein